MNDVACSGTIASSAVSQIACSGILAVLAIFSALIFPMPNVAAGVSAPIRALKLTRSGTIDVCKFTLCIMSITARFFTREHMQSWPFSCISSTKYRNRAKTSVSSQITDTTSPTMHLVIAWCTQLLYQLLRDFEVPPLNHGDTYYLNRNIVGTSNSKAVPQWHAYETRGPSWH